MKNLLLFSVCLLLIFTSCKKKAEVIPVNTITATVDGTLLTFNANVTGGKGYAEGITTIHVSGFTTADNTAAIIGISISSTDANALQKGTYTFSSTNTHPTVYPYLVYNTPVDNASQQPFTTDATGVQITTITITSVSSTNIQGTFSGVLLHAFASDTKTVANGKFNVNIQ
ncbi:MAG TPA: hypothetical protein VFE54_08690 [Mucilaginibacter sp.]|jgi:hypothetical protein|nr:hypothetical protein [Mucilaginibacter sp.]